MFLSFFTTALLLFQIGSAPADSAHLWLLSVSKALEIAYRQHPQINILQQQIVAQEKQQVLSWGIDDPEIRYFREGIGNNTFTEQRWAITQRIEFPLSSYYRMKNERAITESMQLKLADLKYQVRADVKASYTKLIYALRTGELSSQQVELFENLRRAAQARSDMGESSDIDAMQANLQLEESRISMECTFPYPPVSVLCSVWCCGIERDCIGLSSKQFTQRRLGIERSRYSGSRRSFTSRANDCFGSEFRLLTNGI